jgi:cell division protease FtsH
MCSRWICWWRVWQDDGQASPQTREVIDSEVQRIIKEQYERARGLLREHRAALDALTQQLLKQEPIDGSAVKAALQATAAAT